MGDKQFLSPNYFIMGSTKKLDARTIYRYIIINKFGSLENFYKYKMNLYRKNNNEQ